MDVRIKISSSSLRKPAGAFFRVCIQVAKMSLFCQGCNFCISGRRPCLHSISRYTVYFGTIASATDDAPPGTGHTGRKEAASMISRHLHLPLPSLPPLLFPPSYLDDPPPPLSLLILLSQPKRKSKMVTVDNINIFKCLQKASIYWIKCQK